MTPSALILTAHGSRDSFAADAAIYRHTDVLSGCTPFDRVTVAFHSKGPSIADVLSALRAFNITIVPFMTSGGYFTKVVLQRELAQSWRHTARQVCVTSPVGTHPGIIPLVRRRVEYQLSRLRLDGGKTSLAIVGHGTSRHRQSRQATEDLVARLRHERVCSEAFPVFLEDKPNVSSVPHRAKERNIIVIPFLMSCGQHTMQDIPDALGVEPSSRPGLPVLARTKGRLILCDTPVGTDPGIVEIVAELASPPCTTPLEEVA